MLWKCYQRLFCTIKKNSAFGSQNQPTYWDSAPHTVPVKTTVFNNNTAIYLYLEISMCTHLYIYIHTWIYKNSSWTHILEKVTTHPYGWCWGICYPLYSFLLVTPFCWGNKVQAQTSNADRIWNYDTVEPSRNSLLKKLGPKC